MRCARAREVVLQDGSPPLHRDSIRGRYRAYHSNKTEWITVAGAAPDFRTSRLTFSAENPGKTGSAAEGTSYRGGEIR